MNHYIFIIPKTPSRFQDKTRKELWSLCLQTLIGQSYKNWTALIVGENTVNDIKDERFIEVNFEGKKEAKLQKATQYIQNNNIKGEYVVRLDDDDIINPNVLERISGMDFDLFVDKHQWFWHFESGKISNRVWFWFPNTCIHKREHALNEWGDFAEGSFPKFKKQALLIENDHSKLHPYYKNKKVIFAEKKRPLYLRTITSSSITAKNSKSLHLYFKNFGNWSKNELQDFKFLLDLPKSQFSTIPKISQTERILNIYHNFRYFINYRKAIKK